MAKAYIPDDVGPVWWRDIPGYGGGEVPGKQGRGYPEGVPGRACPGHDAIQEAGQGPKGQAVRKINGRWESEGCCGAQGYG